MNCPKAHTKLGRVKVILIIKPHSIQDTFLSLELNLYSLSRLLHTNNCKAILRTESYFNTAVRRVITCGHGNSFCFLLNNDNTCMLENR